MLLLVVQLFFAQSFVLIHANGLAERNEYSVDLPPRFQWNANFGYCGEVSLISAGLSFGQFLSQFDSRAAACEDKAQNRCQMLLGVNDESAAKNMHMKTEEFGTIKEKKTEDFLVWVKSNVAAGKRVIIGVFTNEYLFYNDTDKDAGDPEYDHIIPVLSVTSTHDDLTKYYDDDIISFSDNGLWGLPSNPPYIFNYTFGQFQKSRRDANSKTGDVYSLANTAANYGLAVSGIRDKNDETVAVRVDTNVNYETPEMKKNSNTRPESMPLTLTVTVTNTATDNTTNFVLYKYNKLSKVPDADFHSKASDAVNKWEITIQKGETYVLTEKIQSDEVAAYRAVKA